VPTHTPTSTPTASQTATAATPLATPTVTNTALPVPTASPNCLVIAPSGLATVQTQNTPVGCAVNWQCARSIDGDGSYVFSLQTGGSGSRTDLYALDDVEPRPEPIASVIVHIVSRTTVGLGASAATPQLKIGSLPIIYEGAPFAPPTTYTDSATTYSLNPATLAAWTWADINTVQAGVRHEVATGDELRTTAVYAQVCWLAPTSTPTTTSTVTPTGTSTATSTATPSFTPPPSPTVSFTATVSPTNTVTPSPPATPTRTPTPTAVPNATTTSTATLTPTPMPTDTATQSPTPSVTATPTITPTASVTPTQPTPTPTPLPNIPFLFVSGSNQYNCVFNLAFNPPLMFSAGTDSFRDLARKDAAALRDLYQVIYVAPDLADDDYQQLQTMVAPDGVIAQFVNLGGVAVINVAGALGDRLNIAPGGVGFSNAAQHLSEQILVPQHAYFTGAGFGGEVLGTSDFANWQPTDYGTLTNLPGNAAVLLANNDDASLAEYQYGEGRVIVSTLAYCWDGKPASQGAAARNLLRYSRFYTGSAQTPGPTITQTGTATPTRTVTPTRTARPTEPPTPTPTPSPTLSPIPILLGDTNGDGAVDEDDLPSLIEALFMDTPPAEADVNTDSQVTAADLPAFVELLQ
jgi:hypothetical protein